MPEYFAGKVTDYADGDRKVVDCGESEIGIFKIDGEFFAWHNRCAHRAGPVCQGRIMKRVIEPVADDRTTRAQGYDQSEINIRTGCHQGNSRVRLRKAELTIREDEIYVQT
jgi:nitrite reductase (NADH) small subunit